MESTAAPPSPGGSSELDARAVQTHPSNQDWPAGALLPEPGLMKQWAWRALAAAREEIHLAVESVMEDLEGLSAGCSAVADRSPNSESSSSSTFLDDLPSGNGGEDEEDVLRVDDLVAPVPRRAEYELEYDPPETHLPYKADHDWVVLDFEVEASIISFR